MCSGRVTLDTVTVPETAQIGLNSLRADASSGDSRVHPVGLCIAACCQNKKRDAEYKGKTLSAHSLHL